jgi:hypothetical protein
VEFLRKKQLWAGFFLGAVISIGLLYWFEPGKPFPSLGDWNDIAQIFIACGAIVAASVAWRGLDVWKKQLHGNTDHDIAWKYLEATLKLRNAINEDVRNPAIFPNESQSASEEYYGKEGVENAIKTNPRAATIAVYILRWREVNKARIELKNAIVQAEIWWGKKVVGLEKPLYKCIGTLYVQLMNFLYPEDRGVPYDHDTLYFLEGADTGYDRNLTAAVKQIEDFARQYLRESDSKTI